MVTGGFLFWAGLVILLGFAAAFLFTLWRKRVQDYDDEVGLIEQFGLPFLITALVITGVVFLGMGNPKWSPVETKDFVPPSVPRTEFVDQVKADKEATKPQTRSALEEERASKVKDARKSEEAAEKAKDEAAQESIDDFRAKMMQSRSTEYAP